jgi:hypothetical protein
MRDDGRSSSSKNSFSSGSSKTDRNNFWAEAICCVDGDSDACERGVATLELG